MRQTFPARQRTDSPLTVFLRYAFFLLFFFAIWTGWQWGYGLIAILLIVATGVPGIHRFALVPLPGWSRVLLELILSIAGMIATYQLIGRGWGTVLLVVHLLYLIMSMKRFSFLARA